MYTALMLDKKNVGKQITRFNKTYNSDT